MCIKFTFTFTFPNSGASHLVPRKEEAVLGDGQKEVDNVIYEGDSTSTTSRASSFLEGGVIWSCI